MALWSSEVKQYGSVTELHRECADFLVQAASKAIKSRGFFSLVVAGGNTPRGLYALLAEPQISDLLDWAKIFIFWSDERCVPSDHPESNFRMVQETLLSKIAIPLENIFRMPGELPADEGAKYYENILADFMAKTAGVKENISKFLVFDFILLGLGSDGHTASIFPGSDALKQENQMVYAVSVSNTKPAISRLTLTLPVLNQARNVCFLVSGIAKKEITRKVLADNSASLAFPAARVKPVGRLNWFVCFV